MLPHEAPSFWYEDKDDGNGPCFWWTNPWSGQREKIASLWWPAHPIEATEAIEHLFESLELRVGDGPWREDATAATKEPTA